MLGCIILEIQSPRAAAAPGFFSHQSETLSQPTPKKQINKIATDNI